MKLYSAWMNTTPPAIKQRWLPYNNNSHGVPWMWAASMIMTPNNDNNSQMFIIILMPPTWDNNGSDQWTPPAPPWKFMNYGKLTLADQGQSRPWDLTLPHQGRRRSRMRYLLCSCSFSSESTVTPVSSRPLDGKWKDAMTSSEENLIDAVALSVD